MGPYEYFTLFLLHSGRAKAHVTNFAAAMKRRKAQRGCSTVARKRASRYLARHRMPRAIWPILVALFIIVTVFERLDVSNVIGRALSRRCRIKARSLMDKAAVAKSTLPSEMGAGLSGDAILDYRPPVDFQARHASQIVAFLIRNRGRLDTDVVREKWKHLDGFSLPLAVYLRDIDANGRWSGLQNEIAASPPSLNPTLSSNRCSTILKLIPEWEQRGKDLLASFNMEATAPAGFRDHRPDDDTLPKP